VINKKTMKPYLIIDNLLTPERCQELIDLSESKGYDEADISFQTGAKMNKEYRDNERCLYTSEDMRVELEKLLSPYVFEKTQEFLKVSGRFRFYKYNPSQKFKKHRDESILEEGGISLCTVLFYLNTPDEGGETAIYDPNLENPILVKAEQGRVLIFDHSIAHTGEELKRGQKYILRTDFIYKINTPDV
jgi:predicted 2-oxoglutarate/Fe(II)-dependent dioxygenase YbiX